MSFIRQKSGLFLCILSLIILFLLRLPLNLSVACANENQGFAFTWGQSLLLWNELACGRGILHVLIFAAVLKVFGFTTYSIIAIHILETIILISTGVLIYLIVKKILDSEFFAGLSVLFWLIMNLTPIGKSSLMIEILSHYTLNGETLCVLFSLGSILCLINGGLIDTGLEMVFGKKEKVFSVAGGFLAVCSFMVKTNGAILLIATVLWFFCLSAFQKTDFKVLSTRILYYFSGVVISLLIFYAILYSYNHDLISLWRDYYFAGSYTQEHLKSIKTLLKSFFMFMTRYTNSVSNFILFFITIILFICGVVKSLFKNQSKVISFWLLMSLWGFGNICVIIIPGEYQPYYYYLIWPSIAIVFVLGLYELSNRKIILAFASLFISIFFLCRIYISIPSHYYLIRALTALSIFNQPQSFQDPVLHYKANLSFRPRIFQLADAVNSLLPDKSSTFYILDFSNKGLIAFTPLSYIYAKRYAPTTVDAGLLGVPNIIETKLKDLKRDLARRKPDIFIVSKSISLQPWQVRYLPSFLEWVNNLIKEEYRLETFFNLVMPDNQSETFLIYRKIK